MVISLMLAFLIVLLFVGSISPQVLLNIVGASQTRSNESTKVNSWLRGETEQWLTSDPLHRVSVIAWLNESYLRDHNANQSGVANHFVTEYNAVITRIGFLPYIIADVSSNMIGEIAQEQVIDVLFSAKYPEFQLSSDNILADVAANGMKLGN